MGLDMYLYRREWIPFDHRGSVRLVRTDTAVEEKAPAPLGELTYALFQVAYWRKANAIHRWFVENVQDGVDNCASYYVSRSQLETLKDLCAKVLAASRLVEGVVTNGYHYKNGTKEPIHELGRVLADAESAQELLPTQDGFFFGSTDYDEWYYDDIRDTRDQLATVLAGTADDFVYWSSW
jgi:hypothetical protein